MNWNNVEISRRGRVAVVKFETPNALNALSLELMLELAEAASSFRDDPETAAVVLTGSNRGFSAGMDLRDPRLLDAVAGSIGKRRRALAAGPDMCRAWESIEQVTIAAIEGYCVGGGVSLAVSCDFRIMGRGAHFRVPELALGMNMSWQTLPRLTHLVGPARTKQIVILAERVDSEQALNWGLVEEIAEDGQTLERALVLADKIAAMPPIPVKMTKQAVNVVTAALDHCSSFMDIDQFMLCQMTGDHREGVSAYLEKRKPVFKGE
jgi:enoyl-CoA hydratase/carnithine racemase